MVMLTSWQIYCCAARLKVNSLASISLEEENQFVQMMNNYGATVLVPKEESDPLAVYKTLDRWFGKCVPHDAMNEHGNQSSQPNEHQHRQSQKGTPSAYR